MSREKILVGKEDLIHLLEAVVKEPNRLKLYQASFNSYRFGPTSLIHRLIADIRNAAITQFKESQNAQSAPQVHSSETSHPNVEGGGTGTGSPGLPREDGSDPQ